MQKKVQGSEDKTAKAERSRREGDGGTWIFFADCVCVKPVFESYLICVYMNVLSFPHSFRAKFIPLERGEGILGGKRAHTEAAAWLGARGPGGAPEEEREFLCRLGEWSRCWLDKGPCFQGSRCALHFWEGCEHQQDFRSCVSGKAVPWLPGAHASGPALGEVDTQPLSTALGGVCPQGGKVVGGWQGHFWCKVELAFRCSVIPVIFLSWGSFLGVRGGGGVGGCCICELCCVKSRVPITKERSFWPRWDPAASHQSVISLLPTQLLPLLL